MGDMSPTMHSAKLHIVCGLIISKTAALKYCHHSNFLHVHVLCACMVGGYSQGGQPACRGGGRVPPPPK